MPTMLVAALACATSLVTNASARPSCCAIPVRAFEPPRESGWTEAGDRRLILRLAPGASLTIGADGRAAITHPAVDGAVSELLSRTVNSLGGEFEPALPFKPASTAAFAASGLDRFVALRLDASADADAVVRALAEYPSLIVSVRPSRIGRAATQGTIPDDPLFPLQYALLNTGQTVQGQQGIAGADIRATGAWAFGAVGTGVVVAVLDSGISASHPDLLDRLLPGWNFVGNNDNTDDEYSSHGTHCAGIAAASGDNGVGIAGVAWSAGILPVKVLNKYGFGTELLCGAGLVWAADRGARVASVSIGFDPAPGGDEDTFLRAAVDYATAAGMLVVASAGNTPTAPVVAPARYPNAVAVGATDNRDILWPASATGPEISVVAPGVGIISTWDSKHFGQGENTYDYATGTSQACPHVAGLAALLFAVDPSLTPAKARRIIESTADDLGPPGRDDQHGHGRINAERAVRAALAHLPDDAINGDEWWWCVADFNRDGIVDTRDFVGYLNAWAGGEDDADIAAPFGVVDTLDFLAFLNWFAKGCP
ncbi:MAG: S8 family serine peptidase [Phycisphaerales bacterium]|nr:S8 family serine peptidase [Phycisphaerales bacterium]